MKTWEGTDKCTRCGTTILGKRTNDNKEVLCLACFNLKHFEVYCDICAYQPGWGVIDGLIYCEKCYSKIEENSFSEMYFYRGT